MSSSSGCSTGAMVSKSILSWASREALYNKTVLSRVLWSTDVALVLTVILATVVFSATAIARMVRDEFRKRARQSGPYRDVQVSFSHDPCERPLNLISQIPSSRNDVRPSNGSSTSHSFPRPSVPISPCQGPSVSRSGEDGWQTVARRR
jgi:hypothetical protein